MAFVAPGDSRVPPPQGSASIELTKLHDESFTSLSYLPEKQAVAVAGKQAYIVAIGESPGGSVAFTKAGTLGSKPVLLAWQPGGSSNIAMSDAKGALFLYDAVLCERVAAVSAVTAALPTDQPSLYHSGGGSAMPMMSSSGPTNAGASSSTIGGLSLLQSPSTLGSNNNNNAAFRPGWVVSQKLVPSQTLPVNRSKCAIAWNPHTPTLLAHASPDCALALWDVRSPPAHASSTSTSATSVWSGGGASTECRGVSLQGNDISFSPMHPHMVAVAAQAFNANTTGTLLLFDQRNLSVSLASVPTNGSCTAVAFHPIYADLLAYSYKQYGTRRDAKIEFLDISVDAKLAPPRDASVDPSVAVRTPPWFSQTPQERLQPVVCIARQDKIRWRPVPQHHSEVSPMWFATCSPAVDTAANVWDAFNPFTPVLAGRNLHVGTDKQPRFIGDMLWMNSSTLLTCGIGGGCLVASTIQDGMWSHHQELPTTAVAARGFGEVIVIRDEPVLRELYEADLESNSHQSEAVAERTPGGAVCFPVSPHMPTSNNSDGRPPQHQGGGTAIAPALHASNMSSSSGGPTANNRAQPALSLIPPVSGKPPPSNAASSSVVQQPKKEKEGFLHRLFGGDKTSQPSSGSSTAQHNKQQQPAATATNTSFSNAAAAQAPSASSTSASPSLRYDLPPAATTNISPLGLFPSVMELPLAFFSHDVAALEHQFKPPKPNAIIETVLLDFQRFPTTNYVVRTSKKTFRTLAKAWDSRYEEVVLLRQKDAIDADDIVTTKSVGSEAPVAAVDTVVAAVFAHNQRVSMRRGKLLSNDPRVCIWGSIGLAFELHDPGLILQLVTNALNYLSQCGDAQAATFLYITTVLWWRQRAAASGSLVDIEGCVLLQPEWKQRAYQWVASYASLLQSSELWTEWNELEYVFPYTVRAASSGGLRRPMSGAMIFDNPCFCADIPSDKAHEFVYCCHCQAILAPGTQRSYLDSQASATAPPPGSASNALYQHHQPRPQARCKNCVDRALHVCVICEQSVHGLYLWMKPCGHGGHMHHIQEWIDENDSCPKCGVLLIDHDSYEATHDDR